MHSAGRSSPQKRPAATGVTTTPSRRNVTRSGDGLRRHMSTQHGIGDGDFDWQALLPHLTDAEFNPNGRVA